MVEVSGPTALRIVPQGWHLPTAKHWAFRVLYPQGYRPTNFAGDLAGFVFATRTPENIAYIVNWLLEDENPNVPSLCVPSH